MAESLFTSQTPANPNVNDATPISLGTTLTFDVAGNVTHIRFFAPTTVSGSFVGGIYRITTFDTGGFDPGVGAGTLLGSATFGSITAGAWNQVALSSSVAVNTTDTYRVVMYSSAGRYVSSANLFTGVGGISNANINGLRHNQGGGSNVFNGTYNYATGISYTNDHSSNEGYFVDVVFEPGGGGGTNLPYDGEAKTPLLADTPARVTLDAAYTGDAVTTRLQDAPAYAATGIATNADLLASAPIPGPARAAVAVATASDALTPKPLPGPVRSALGVDLATDARPTLPARGLASYELTEPSAEDLPYDADGIGPRVLPALARAQLDELFQALSHPTLLADMPVRSATGLATAADGQALFTVRNAASRVLANQVLFALARAIQPARGLAVATISDNQALPVDVYASFSVPVVKASLLAPVIVWRFRG